MRRNSVVGVVPEAEPISGKEAVTVAAAATATSVAPEGVKTRRMTAKRKLDDSAVEDLIALKQEETTIEKKAPCECGMCFRLKSYAHNAAEVTKFFDAKVNLGVSLLRVEKFGPSHVTYDMEFHCGNIRRVLENDYVDTVLVPFDEDVERRMLEHASARMMFSQYVALCARLRRRTKKTCIRFFSDTFRRLFAFPTAVPGARNYAINIKFGKVPVMQQCALAIIQFYYGSLTFKVVSSELKSKGVFNVKLIPAAYVTGEPTDVLLVDFLRTAMDVRTPKEDIHLHPFFCVQTFQLANELPEWRPHFTDGRMSKFVNNQEQTDLLMMGAGRAKVVNPVRSQDASHTFYALCRDARTSTNANKVTSENHRGNWFDIITPGPMAGRRTCTFFAKDESGDHTQLYLSLSSASREEGDLLYVRCHACIGMRMCNPEASVIGTNAHVHIMGRHAEQLESTRASAEVDFKSRLQLAHSVLHFFGDLNADEARTRFGTVESIAQHAITSIQFTLNHPVGRATLAFWSAVEAILVSSQVTYLLETRFFTDELSRYLPILPADKEQYTRKYLLLLAELNAKLIRSDIVPEFVKNALISFGICGVTPSGQLKYEAPRICTVSALTELARCGGGCTNPDVSRYMKLTQAIPVCVIRGSGHGDARAGIPFAMMSIMRSPFLKDLNSFDILNLPRARFFSSKNEGRGLGVSTTIVNDFFVSLLEDHDFFRIVKTNDEGTPMVALPYEIGRGNCKGCSKFLETLNTSHVAKETSGCFLHRSQNFAKCLAFMLRYALLSEQTIPFRIHPTLLRVFMEANTNDRSALFHGSFRRLNATNLSLCRTDVMNGVLAPADSELKSLEMTFPVSMRCKLHMSKTKGAVCENGSDGCECVTELQRATRLSYIKTEQDFGALAGHEFGVWWSCVANEFHTPFLTMLIRSSCGGSPTAFSEVLSGNALMLNGADILSNVKIDGAGSQEESFVGIVSSPSVKALQLCKYVCRSFSLWKEYFTTKMADFVECALVDVARCGEVLESLEPSDPLLLARTGAAFSELLRSKYFLTLAALLGGSAKNAVDTACESLIFANVAMATFYFVRWTLECSQKEALRFVYISTGKRTIHTTRDEASEKSYRAPIAVAALDGLRKEVLRTDEPFSDEKKNRMYEMLRSNIRSSQDLSTIIRMSVLSGVAAVFQKVNLKTHPLFKEGTQRVLSCGEFNDAAGLLPVVCDKNVSLVINWKDLRGRLPEYSTCIRSFSIGAYDSYEHFKTCLEKSMEADGFSKI